MGPDWQYAGTLKSKKSVVSSWLFKKIRKKCWVLGKAVLNLFENRNYILLDFFLFLGQLNRILMNSLCDMRGAPNRYPIDWNISNGPNHLFYLVDVQSSRISITCPVWFLLDIQYRHFCATGRVVEFLRHCFMDV